LLLRTANLLDSAVYANFVELRLGELRRKTLPRTPLNNGVEA
jgi:hypothetical protein